QPFVTRPIGGEHAVVGFARVVESAVFGPAGGNFGGELHRALDRRAVGVRAAESRTVPVVVPAAPAARHAQQFGVETDVVLLVCVEVNRDALGHDIVAGAIERGDQERAIVHDFEAAGRLGLGFAGARTAK